MYAFNAATITADSVVPSASAFAIAASHTSSATRTERGGVPLLGTVDQTRVEVRQRQRDVLGAHDADVVLVGVAHVPAGAVQDPHRRVVAGGLGDLVLAVAHAAKLAPVNTPCQYTRGQES